MNQHITYLRQALTLAEHRRGFCAPNPSVGAVVVKNNQVLASGSHWQGGAAHAEVAVLQQLSSTAKGATLYVTLEPCCHWGKTPPCTDLIIRQQIAEVIYAMRDPNPQVSGQGERILQQAGISCQPVVVEEVTQFYQSYNHWVHSGKPWVTVKLAMSLDGKIAGEGGRPVAITGADLTTHTHQQRKRADAILTTGRTICYDNPQLNVRLVRESYGKPVYVLDRHLTLPLDAQIFDTAERGYRTAWPNSEPE